MDGIFSLAQQIGFEKSARLNMSSLIFKDEVRAMCKENKCSNYGRSCSCPPACGSLDEIAAKVAPYKNGVIVRTVGKMSDEFDMECIVRTEKKHKARFDTLVRQTKMFYPDCFPMASGVCKRCRKCTYPQKSCRFPDRMYPSMEACGLIVRDVCKASGIDYYNGKSTITFISCILLEKEK